MRRSEAQRNIARPMTYVEIPPELVETMRNEVVFVNKSRQFSVLKSGQARHSNLSARDHIMEIIGESKQNRTYANAFFSERMYISVDDERFRPNMPYLIEEPSGERFANRWKGWKSAPGDITPFLNYSKVAFKRSEKELEFILNCLAWRLKYGDAHIPFGVTLCGPDIATAPWVNALGRAMEPYVARFSAITMRSTNRSWTREAVLGIFQAGEGSLKHFVNQDLLNQLILAGYHRTRPASQFRDANSENRLFVFITTPSTSEYRMMSNGVYYMVDVQPVEHEVVANLTAWSNAGGAAHLMHWLLNRDISNFTLPSSAPATNLSEVNRRERMAPFERLADDMLGSDVNQVAVWVSQALEWAETYLKFGSGNNLMVSKAKLVLDTFPEITIRPWYTAEEVSRLFPDLATQYGDRLGKAVKGGALLEDYSTSIGRELRKGGLPILMNKDDPRGFLVGAKMQSYYIVSDQKRWMDPISQEDFDREWKNFPSYRQYEAELRKRLNESGEK